MRLKKRTVQQPRVEMLPLIDVVFLLLIFFIYAMLSMAVHRGLSLDLPESSSAQITSSELVSISVKRYGTDRTELLIQVNEERVTLEVLGAKLKNMDFPQDSRQALIFAEESISYQELFRVLDQVKSAGITSISLQANQKREE